MNDETFHAELAEVRQQIHTLPEAQRAPLLALLKETGHRHVQLKEHFARARDALDEWRLLMKYLIFDCEAGRRERDELRRRLGDA